MEEKADVANRAQTRTTKRKRDSHPLVFDAFLVQLPTHQPLNPQHVAENAVVERMDGFMEHVPEVSFSEPPLRRRLEELFSLASKVAFGTLNGNELLKVEHSLVQSPPVWTVKTTASIFMDVFNEQGWIVTVVKRGMTKKNNAPSQQGDTYIYPPHNGQRIPRIRSIPQLKKLPLDVWG